MSKTRTSEVRVISSVCITEFAPSFVSLQVATPAMRNRLRLDSKNTEKNVPLHDPFYIILNDHCGNF